MCEVSNEYEINETAIPRRTLGRTCELATTYKRDAQAAAAAAPNTPPRPQDSMNCIDMPLFNLSDDTEVMDSVLPPELHLMVDITRKFFEAVLDRMKDEEDTEGIET